jgi:metal-responsive CopG/Arc/MetJ family transcriptional regulator
MAIADTSRKITISLPQELVEYADERATALNTSRSQVIGMALAAVRDHSVEHLAAEEYRFYAAESSEFAAATSQAVAESWSDLWMATSMEGSESNLKFNLGLP